MPSGWTAGELQRRKDLALDAIVKGHRLRGFWRRLMVTTIGDFFQGRVWPNTVTEPDDGINPKEQKWQ